ncbi:hypothetical protein [Kibdelosporangium aridum]|uniref:hypothetical protein n=1 Tax=Kibdelosporangium aridum TaxID=2030 RepID=UPI00117A1356|nr:hypothetical protein [Kibdelosporangium aridum]
MSDAEQPEDVDDKTEDKPAADSTEDGKDEPKAEPADDAEDPLEKEFRTTAPDRDKGRQLGEDNRARADAVSALLGGTTQPANIFLNNTIGLLDAGAGGPVDATRGMVVSGAVAEQTLRSVAATFVEPDDYPGLRSKLRARSVVMLRAKPGWGRTTFALRLLHQECVQGVEKLNPDVSLRAPKELGLRAGRGHLLEWLRVNEARQLHEFHFDELKRALDTKGSRMVVLLDPATEIRDEALSAYILDATAFPDGAAVVANHFRAHLRSAGKPEQQIEDFPEFADLVTESIRTARRVGQLAEFARDLGEVALRRADFATIRSRYAGTAEAEFREWFDTLIDNDQRAFAVALAAFNGMPMHIVAETATLLAKDMQAAENPDQRTRTRSLFTLRRSDLIETVGAEVVTEMETTELGPLMAHVVKYRDDRRPRKVLQHVWWEYDEAHAVVRNWLRKLGASENKRVCARAGVAVGLLSLSEFDHARQFVIEKWADADSFRELQAVMGALELPSRQPELQPLLVEMLDKWLKSDSVGRRTAAIKALGTFGIVTPDVAMAKMRRVASREDSTTKDRFAIADALTNMAMIPGRLGQVLSSLLRWTDNMRFPIRNTGLFCSLQLATFLHVSIEESPEPWPALLHVAENEPTAERPIRFRNDTISYRRAVVITLARLLDAPFRAQSLYAELKSWVDTAQKDPAQRAPLGRLFAGLAAETGDEDSLRFYLNEWATERKTNRTEAVADIIAALDEGRVRP